jgi:hypothetical protein
MDSERRGIERNLHDGAQHHLVSLRLTLGLVEHLASAGRLEGAHERLALLLDQLDTAEAVLAETASGVSSATLRRLGPVETLRADLAEAEPPIVVDGDGVGRHDETVEAAVYFSTLEAVNNARKYAGGAPISVQLREADGVLRAVVRDEGPGFTPTPGQGPGRGMRNLATRLATVSGRVDVESAPGTGTTVRVEVPLPAGAAAPRPATPSRRAPAPAAPAPVVVPAEPAPASVPEPDPVAVVPRRAAVVPELGPPGRGPDPAGARAAPPELLPPSGSPLYDASMDLLRALIARTPDRHPAARPLAALLARHGAPWRVGVAAPDPSDAAAVARALAGVHPGTGTVLDLSARAAAGPIAPEDVVDELVLLTRDDAGSSVPGWLADRPTIEVRVVPPGADAPAAAGPAGRTVRVALPGPGTPAGELERVVEALERDARPRAARSRARAVLDGIEAVARADRDPWGRRVLFDVERVRTAGGQELAEAELAEAVRTGRTVLPGAHRDAAVRLLGGEGTSPTARLGLPPDADPEEVGAAAREQRARWQRLAAHLPADRAAREAAEVLVTACEGLISTPGRAAAR